MKRIITFVRTNVVLVIAALLAAVTSIIVPPDKAYIGYFDFKTLTCLFTVLAVVCALRNVRFFYTLAEKIVKRFKNARVAVLALVYITFIGSMLIANDMALLTFLPLGYFVLVSTRKEKYMCVTFILQNIAANLGGMITPFGNPQNLYLYSKFSIPDGEFMLIMLPPFLLAVFMITLSVILFIKPEPLEFSGVERRLPKLKTAIYLVLFAFSIVCVFRLVPYQLALIVIPVAILIMDRRALLDVDYGLLLTFVFFFIFSGNMARIDAVRELFARLLEKSTLVVSALSCQVMSNVPTAILLSRFTDNYKELLLGVNVGGCGTLISSLASLITFKEYVQHNKGQGGKYLFVFSAFNFTFLIIMTLFCLLII
ncbi:MAG: citrate transporter [Ruminococcaceae bacterium]|nr:citrate transporter [Oscillospiraceae bacterium]